MLTAWLARHLSRRTSSGRYIAEVDGLRFFSIAMVVFCHVVQHAISSGGGRFDAAHSWLAQYAWLGRFGPHLFFVISGFVLAYPFAQQHLAGGRPVRLKRYYIRRLTRIEPPYIVALTILFIAFIALRNHTFHELFTHYLAGLGYSHLLLFKARNPVMPISWSLEIEVQFYLLAPLIAAIFALRSQAARVTGFIAVGAAAIALRQFTPNAPVTILNYLELFIAGFIVAEIFVARWKENPRLSLAWDLAAAAALAGLVAVWVHPDAMASQIAFPLLAAVVFCAAFAGRVLRAIVRTPLLTIIGGMCYTIYLLHFALISNITRWSLHLVDSNSLAVQTVVQMFVEVPIVLVVCALFFALIERPCMREDWPRRALAALRVHRPTLTSETTPVS